MIAACIGLGTNSTAKIVECIRRGIYLDVLMFADTGGEQPHTYAHLEVINDYLRDNKYPAITVCNVANETLEENCLRRKQLPSIAYGFKTCSQRFKGDQQNKHMNNLMAAKAEWKAGRKITKFIGFDFDEPERAKEYDDPKYNVEYPLIDWEMGRDECIESIKRAGLPLPGKSSCFFCPSMRPSEIRAMAARYPDLADRAIAMERNAAENHSEVKGLGRNWSWESLLSTDDLFGDESFACMIERDCGCYDG
jgi:hypothetical protein